MTCIGLIWLYVAAMPMAFFNRDYPLWIAKRTMLDECRLGTVAVFGDSRTLAATMPSVMPMPVSNFALSGTSPIETYFAVQRALRCPVLPKLVVISHGALKFGSDSDYWVFGAATGFLTYSNLREVDRDAARINATGELESLRGGEKFPLALREIMYATRFPGLYFGSLVNSFIGLRWQHNNDALHDALLSSGHALFGQAAGSSEVAAEGRNPVFKTSDLIDLYFSRTIAALHQRGVPVYVISMPLNQATYERMPPEFSDSFTAYLRGKEKEFPNLHVVGSPIPCWPDRYFGDAFHLNASGVDQYSRALGEWLGQLLAGNVPPALPDRCTDASAAPFRP